MRNATEIVMAKTQRSPAVATGPEREPRSSSVELMNKRLSQWKPIIVVFGKLAKDPREKFIAAYVSSKLAKADSSKDERSMLAYFIAVQR